MILVTCKIHCIPPHFHTREGSFITITNTRSFLFSFKISSAEYARTNKLGTIRGNMNIFEKVKLRNIHFTFRAIQNALNMGGITSLPMSAYLLGVFFIILAGGLGLIPVWCKIYCNLVQ